MSPILESVQQFFSSVIKDPILSTENIPLSGGDRRYFRLITSNKSYIGCYNENIRENDVFFYFTNHFKKINAPLPTIVAVNEDKKIYIVEDLGRDSLLNILESQGHIPEVFDLFKKSLGELARMQILGVQDLDFDQSLTAKEFGKQAIMADLLYFKYYFVDTLKIPYDKQQLLEDFDALATYLTKTEYKMFMFRDFQSRNIIVNQGDVFFIDYQGGMRGALQYDVASLLFQAKADLSKEWKNQLLDYYISVIDDLLPAPVQKEVFVSQYNGYVVIRMLQVLGAYGFRGLFERKAHFLTSIPLALRNLKWFLANRKVGLIVPTLDSILAQITTNETIGSFEPIQATSETPLLIKVKSFSFLKNGYPVDQSGNGGGFVFDCRGILNPGRYEPYKKITGREKEVMDFLEQQTKMPDFLNNVYNIVDISVEDYIARGFENLSISFGCTGGQHRSVYAAEQTARHLRNKYKVKIELEHVAQGIKEERY
ncbi:MAG: RapZ C-terminal domain-containing protein [Leadbetterella sp.]